MPRVNKLGAGGVDAVLSGDAMPGLATKKRLGRSNGFGFGVFGSCVFGEYANFAGIYQKRVSGYNRYGRSASSPRIPYYVRMRDYGPTNPQTSEQQLWRTVFAEGMQAWNELTPEEKSVIKRRASREGRRAHNYFISEYMKEHLYG